MGIISHLQNIGSQLANGREEDAHEFLRYFFTPFNPCNIPFYCFVIHFKLMNHMTYLTGMLLTQCNLFALWKLGLMHWAH